MATARDVRAASTNTASAQAVKPGYQRQLECEYKSERARE